MKRRARDSAPTPAPKKRRSTDASTGRHDIIVIGGSAGCIEPLLAILAELPADTDATIFVATHRPSFVEHDHLLSLLERTRTRVVVPSRDGELIPRGATVLAPPGQQLVIRDGHVHLAPVGDHARGSIDATFSSAARAFGARVIGVLLSGLMDDGTAGLALVKGRGGLAIVQDPDEAEFPDMPATALRAVRTDAALPASEIAAFVRRHLPRWGAIVRARTERPKKRTR